MKPHIIKLTVFALAIFVLASCGKDPEPVNKLVGNWKVNAVETKILVEGMSFKDYLISVGMSVEEATAYDLLLSQLYTITDVNASMEFKADGTWKGTSDGDPASGKWTLSSDQKTLTLTDDDEPGTDMKATVTTLTDTDLQLDIEEVEEGDDTFASEMTIKIQLKFKRQ